MNFSADVTAEELKVFLEEADEQIELLDEDIVRLEKEEENPDLLQEIFRAAHTLKGSSAMLGYQQMAELTHAMESLLDGLRNGKLSVSTEIIDVLLYSLDALKVLRQDIMSTDNSDLDIAPVVTRLKEAVEGGIVPEPAIRETTLVLDQDARERLQIALVKGQHVYQVKVSLAKSSTWAAVRCLQILNELAQIGEVIISAPSAKEIEEEKVGFELQFILASAEDEDTIQGVISPIDEIDKVDISPYDPEDGVAAGEESTTTHRGVTDQDTQVMEKSPPGIKGVAYQEKVQTLQSVRVDVKVLDNLMNMIGELIVDRSRISRIGKMLGARYANDELIQDLGQTSDHIVKIINELQENITTVRMVPIGTVFSRFPRMVRDLAQKENKKLDFIVEGEETELDRSIIEQIRDPLIHLLRNAVDHGIEPPDKRKAVHKPEMALVRLSAYREQSHIVITVDDDGKGIDGNKVKASAVKKGLISAEAAEKLTEAEAIELIFMASMSTTEKATEVSGRGVGLDIVKTNIEGLSGSISLDTKVGQGSKFTIKLPLTMAIIQGLLVSSGGVSYVIPVVSLVETLKIKQSEIQTIRGKEIIRLRDDIIPLLRLDTTLGNQASSVENNNNLVVVVKAGERLVGIMVDALMEQQEIVVKSFGKHLGDIDGIAGATILGDGQVALILDVASLVNMSMQTGADNRDWQLPAPATRRR